MAKEIHQKDPRDQRVWISYLKKKIVKVPLAVKVGENKMVRGMDVHLANN